MFSPVVSRAAAMSTASTDEGVQSLISYRYEVGPSFAPGYALLQVREL
jgi:hypothetical protein